MGAGAGALLVTHAVHHRSLSIAAPAASLSHAKFL